MQDFYTHDYLGGPNRVILLFMENKRDLTKELLADCFHELMLTTSFDRITIKMITDEARLIRPTFYKHFQDKYEVLEYIFRMEVTNSVDLLLSNGMEQDAIVIFCRCLDKDKKFYRRACQMEPGPNSFEQLLTRYIYETFLQLTERFSVRADPQYKFLSKEVLATYYTYGLVNMIRDWLLGDESVTAEELAASYKYLLSHSVLDMIQGGE